MESVRHALQELIECGDELADELAKAVDRLGYEEGVNFVVDRVGASDEMKSEIERILRTPDATASPQATQPDESEPSDVQTEGVS